MAPDARLTEALARVPEVPPSPTCKMLLASTVVVPVMLTSPRRVTAVVAALVMAKWPLPLMAPFRPNEPLVPLASTDSVAPLCKVMALSSPRCTAVLLATVRKVVLPVTLMVPEPSAALDAALAESTTAPLSNRVPPLWVLAPLKVRLPVPRCTSWPLPLIKPSATAKLLLVLKISDAPPPT